MQFEITRHAREEMERRGIAEGLVERILRAPDQIFDEHGNKKAYQSVVEFGTGRNYLVRSIVDDTVEPARVVTVYRTSKVEKYWSAS